MDPLLIKFLVPVVAFVCLIIGFKVIIWKFGKERCVRCYCKFRKNDLTKAPGFRGNFYVCEVCATIIEHYKDKQ